MEMWFIYSLIAAVFAGIASFLQKVAVERGYDNILFNTIGMVASVIPAYVWAFIDGGDSNVWLAIFLGGISGVVYLFSTFTRTAGMKNIDAALFFPLYKTFGPIMVTIIGYTIFKESLSVYELLGIVLGIVVPLLLIHKSENARQNNLKKGVLLVLATVAFTSIAAITSKTGANLMESVFLFTAIANTFGGVVGIWMVYNRQRNKNKKIDIAKAIKNKSFVFYAVLAGFMNIGAFITMLYALKGGALAIVVTIKAFSILIPIILSIIIYKEHWNARKAFAIGLSIVALAFLH